MDIEKIKQYLASNNYTNENEFKDTVKNRHKPPENKSFKFEHPHLTAEWNTHENEALSPEWFTSGSNYLAKWICPEGHKFSATIKNRTRGSNCPKCKHYDSSYNFAQHFPTLLEEWNYEKNENEKPSLEPNKVAPKSDRIAWWTCKYCKHEWQSKISNRAWSKGNGCKKCSSQRKSLTSTNNLAFLYPEVALEWHPSKNIHLKPAELASRSSQKAWWLCKKCSHEWSAVIASRTEGKQKRGCPKCAGKVVTKEGSFEAKYSGLLKFWHPTKNSTLKPSEVSPKSKKLGWWLCNVNKKHEWQSTFQSLANGARCPYCQGRRVLPEESFATRCPEGAQLWDYEKNALLKPEQYSSQSNQKAWWRCPKGHGSWTTTIQSIFSGRRCKKCNGGQSIKEMRIAAELKGLGFEVESLYKLPNSHQDECDIYLPEYKIVIEIDGPHHKNKQEIDQRKGDRISALGLTLIRVRDKRLPELPGLCIPYEEKENNLDVCKRLVSKLLEFLQPNNDKKSK